MTMAVCVMLVTWLLLVDNVTPQPGIAADIITDAVLADIGVRGIPFPLSLLNENNRGSPNDALNIGESFFLSSLHQGDQDALLHLDQLHQSVNSPMSLMHQLFHILRQPPRHRGSNLLGQLHNLAITRGLIPNTHAFVVRQPQTSETSLTALTTQSTTHPNRSMQLRGQATIYQQIIEAMKKGNHGTTQTSDLANTKVAVRTETTREPKTKRQQNVEFGSTHTNEPRNQVSNSRPLNNIDHSESKVNQPRQNPQKNNSGGRLWNIVGQWNNGKETDLETRKVTLRDLISSGNPREIGARLTQTYTTEIPQRLIKQTIDLKPLTKVAPITSTLPTRVVNFEASLKPIPFVSLRIGRVALQPIRSPVKPADILKRAGHGNINEEDITIEIPNDTVITNLSVIVEDSRLDLGKLAEIDVYSDDSINKTKAEFILQEVGELDLKPKDVRYQYVGDVYNRITGPKSRIGKQGKVNMEHKRQYLMQLQSDSGNFDNTAVAESIGPWTQLPGEVIRIHGNGSTRLVTREKVIIERLGFVNFQVGKPVGIEKRSYRLKHVTVPVLRVDVSRRDYLSHNKTIDKSNTILQYVGDILIDDGNLNNRQSGHNDTSSADGLKFDTVSNAVNQDAIFSVSGTSKATIDETITASNDNVNTLLSRIEKRKPNKIEKPIERGKPFIKEEPFEKEKLVGTGKLIEKGKTN